MYPLSLSILVALLILESSLIYIATIGLMLFLPLFLIALYQLLIKKTHGLKDIFYLLFSLDCILGLVYIIESNWTILLSFVGIISLVGWLIAFVRPIIWLYKRSRKKEIKDAPSNTKRIWRIVVISIIGVPILFFLWGMYKTHYMSGVSSRDVEDYISGRYLSFPGGEEIRGCIPAYEELDDYESLRFGYFDGRRKNNFFRTFYISFGLYVEYSEEEYLEKKRQAGVTNNYNDYTGTTQGYKFVEEGSLNHVVYGALYRDGYNTIEYVAICGDDGDAIKEGWLFAAIYQWNGIIF